MKKLILISFAALSFSGYSQTASTTTAPAEKEWDVNLYGFVRTDYIWDTRRSAQVREYNLNLYPLDEQLDANGDDINATGASNFLSIVSRLGVKVKGPNVWGAKVTGNLEGDFFGNTEASIGLFRLRHAYANLEWAKTSLTMGQTWYPTFIPEVFPGVANFSTGILFNPFGWASQVRLKQSLTNNLSFSLTAYKEREFTTQTATGGSQNSASFNSSLPTIHGQFQFKNKNWLIGLGAEYKSLKPLISSNGLVSDEKVNSTSIVGYFKYANDKISIKGYGISGSDMYNLVMLGGFAGYTASPTSVEKYEPIKTSAYWVDIASMGKSIAPGLFVGLTKNGGVDKDNPTAVYARGFAGTRGVDQVYRVAARVDFKQNKFRITPELEYTGATWGNLDPDLTINGSEKKVGNFRAMVSCAYSF